ncbi:MAG: type III PLP-dependent enzyme [Rhodospirillaceae bacterium]|nr:type III PLP-dependent enzyme [Rhodospirillaceae bacterium]
MFRPKSGSSARSIRNLSQNEDPAVKSNTIERITDYIANYELPSPCLVLDVDAVEENYKEMARLFPSAKIYYAVKANPAEMLVKRLDQLGACFDTASPGEFDMCIRLGIAPSRISYGNTIKKQADIAYAYAQGIRLFAFDSENELEKIAASAPGSQVYCRILVESGGAEWPLSRKFGCAPEMALELLIKAQELGLDAYGVSFHVGSQQVNLDRWEPAIAKVAEMFAQAKKRGVNLRLIDMGGGFPTHYRTDVEPIKSYAQKISAAMDKHFGTDLPDVILEPGRSLVGGAGIIQAEVVLISRKSAEEKTRWVYLDIGKFSGLAETMDEAIKYHIVTSRDGGPTGPVVLAGPTCDSADIMYEKTHYEMPLDLKEGDKVLILATGAYTTTYSSVNFNGFAPLGIVCI